MLTLHRLHTIDLMRGLVIVLMALDHTRDFFSSATIDPTDLSQTTPALFLTRWITHLCAPTFVFLAGSSAYLAAMRHQMNQRQLAGYLLTRGLWLIVLELTIVHFGWTFNWNLHHVVGQVIWVLGWSMISLAGLAFLPRWAIGLLALAIIGGHNLFDGIKAEAFGQWAWLWTVLHVPGTIELFPSYSIFILYPLIPWAGVMAAGYCAASVFLLVKDKREKVLLLMGVCCIAAFLVLRLPNIYGDSVPWQSQGNSLFDVFAIVNFEKYPPSLSYLLMTLGLMFLGLAVFESERLQRWGRPLLIFGRVPMFFYVLHLMVIHGGMLIITWRRGLPVDWLFSGFPKLPSPDFGYGLPAVYGFWLLLILLLYPLCLAYSQLRKHYADHWWMSYL